MARLEGDGRTKAESGFPVTRWTLVNQAVGAGTTSQEALEKLCRDYWYPLYAFARRSGSSAPDAEDLTQGFFEQLLQKAWLSDADRAKGKLRTFLLTAFRRYQANEWRRGSASRRGGGQMVMFSELDGVEERYADARPGLSAEELFDRQWALTLLGRTLESLAQEFSDAGKEREYEVLKDVLMAERGELDYAKLAGDIGVSEGAARVAAHRLRKRFRQRFRATVAGTLEEGEDLSEEMAYLVQVLAG